MSVPEGFVELAPEAIQDAGRLPLFVRVALVSREELMLWAGDVSRKLRIYPRVLHYGGPTTAGRVPELRSIVDNWTRLVLTQTGQLWTPVWDREARILPNGLMGLRWPFTGPVSSTYGRGSRRSRWTSVTQKRSSSVA